MRNSTLFQHVFSRKFAFAVLFVMLACHLNGQYTLAKWYNADFIPTVQDDKIDASKIKRNSGSISNISWGSDNIFYSTDGWPKPDYSNSSAAVLNDNNYLQFSISPRTGYKIPVTRFTFNGRMQGGTSKMQVRYSKRPDFSTYTVLQSETTVTAAYTTYSLNFPASTTVNSGEELFIRIYIYGTENNFHLQHNISGSIAPQIEGEVMLMNPVKPVAKDDYAGTAKNTAVTVDVLGNDDYRYSGLLSAVNVVNAPKNGTAAANGVKEIIYTPKQGYTGYDSFYYTITNAAGVSNTAKVEVQIVDGAGQVLTQWKTSNYTATNYRSGAFGLNLTKSEKMGLSINAQEGFQLSSLPTPQEFDGGPDPQKYVQLGIKIGNAEDYTGLLKSFNLQYRSQANDGSLTVKYSKSADFTGNVYTMMDAGAMSKDYKTAVLPFTNDAFLYPGETVYIRIYGHNTYNNFFIKYLATSSEGPAITGSVSEYAPEPCTKTAVWNGTAWSIPPTINTKAVLNGSYDTQKNGMFQSCSLAVNAGTLTIAAGKSLTVNNEIKLTDGSTLEVQNDANLIQLNDAAPANTGDITVLRDIKLSKGRAEYNYLGTPVSFAAGETFKTIYPGITYALYYNESNNYFYASSGVNVPGRGLAVKEPTLAAVPSLSEKVTAKFVGVPQNGIISFPLANSNTGSSTSLGTNLVGNPYPSNIDLVKLYALNSGKTGGASVSPISATFYLWDSTVNTDYTQQGSSYSGQAYAVFNAAAGSKGTGTSAAGYLTGNISGKKTPTQVVKVGQGFLVKSLTKNGVLQFSNAVRTDSSAPIEFMGKTTGEKEDDRYWLTMTAPSQLKTSMAVVYFDGGSQGFGVEDSESRGGSDELFSMVDGTKTAINGRNIFSNDDTVALGARHFVNGQYTISLEKAEGIFANGQAVYLKDKNTGIWTDLTQGSYSFTAGAGETTGRFEIKYQTEAVLSSEGTVKEELTVYRENNDFVVKSASKKITALELYDMNGRLVVQTKPHSNSAVVRATALTSGIYIMKIEQDGKVTAKKIIKQ